MQYQHCWILDLKDSIFKFWYCSNVAKCIIREIAASLRSDDEPSTEEEIIVQDASHDGDDVAKKSLQHFLDQQVAQASTRNSIVSELTMQMQQYLRVSNLERKQDPLEWWRGNCQLYPHISKLARKYLSKSLIRNYITI